MKRQEQFDFDKPLPQNVHFDGATYEPSKDLERLGRQMQVVISLMSDGHWRTLSQIEDATNFPQASISARLRDLRKERWGKRTVDRRRKDKGLFEYRLVPE